MFDDTIKTVQQMIDYLVQIIEMILKLFGLKKDDVTKA